MKNISYMVMICLLALLMVNNPITDRYVASLKGQSVPTSAANTLMDEIALKAKEYEVPPTDAKIDPVWKAMPGLNGLKVDIKASYKKMKKDKEFNPEKFVFQEVSPKIHLDDLPPNAIYKGHPDKPMVSFIINVAWGNEYISPILATLKKNNVHASFFLEGRWVKENPELAKMIVDAGHEVGNHSYSHPDMKIISASRAREEIQKTNQVIEATTGKVPTWFAPPSGSYRDEVVQIAAKEKLKTVMWSVDTIDWQKPTPDVLINRVISKIHNGAMVLMHPTDYTAKALDPLIKQIQAKDIEIDTVSKLLSEDRVIRDVTGRN